MTSISASAVGLIGWRALAGRVAPSTWKEARVRPLLAAAATAALVAIAGCSSQSQGTLTPTVSPASTVRAVAPPTTVKSRTLSRAAAARRYLEIVRPYNVALERLEQAFNSGAPLVRLRALADAVAGTNATQMRQLRATVWPSAVRSPMKQLLTESAAAQPYWRQAAEASTREELARSVLEAARHDGTGPANKIRRALGLDDYNETDVS